MGEKSIEREAILNMTEFLMSYGFEPEEAFNVSKSFWKKHKKKLKRII